MKEKSQTRSVLFILVTIKNIAKKQKAVPHTHTHTHTHIYIDIDIHFYTHTHIVYPMAFSASKYNYCDDEAVSKICPKSITDFKLSAGRLFHSLFFIPF